MITEETKWQYIQTSCNCVEVFDENNTMVCEIIDESESQPRSFVNAAIIAKAPEVINLLDAIVKAKVADDVKELANLIELAKSLI